MKDRNLRVVVLGAGMAGMLATIKLREAGFDQLALYEKANTVGGTWRENTYPGLTCDVPSHHYTYTFERNPGWTRHLPPGVEVQGYFQHVFAKYGLAEVTRFGEEVTEACFDNGRWHLRCRSGLEDEADIVIAATGVLHHPRLPAIDGIDSFRGALFHSARWDHSVTLEGKRVGVIGNGSTGVQLISALAGKVEHLVHFQRTAQWIMPVENGHFSPEERQAFEDPAVLEEAMDFAGYNASVDAYTQAIIDEESEGAKGIAAACFGNLEQSVTDPDLREKLRPDHKPLCKRLVFSPDYYQAIQHPQSQLVTEDIASIEEDGIRTQDGVLHELEVIVFATGFDASAFMRPITVTGRDGKSLDAFWADHPKAYYAISMPDFPNFFMLNGPNGPVGNFSLIDIAEHQWHYIAQLIERISSGQADELCCKAEALRDFEQRRSEAARETVWYKGGCTSWYLDSRGIPASWPWTYSTFVDAMNEPQWADFELR